MLGLMPLVGLVLAVASALAVVAVKWSLIGRIAPTIKPLWSTFVCLCWPPAMAAGRRETLKMRPCRLGGSLHNGV